MPPVVANEDCILPAVKTFALDTSGIAGTFSIGGSASANATADNVTVSFNGGGAQNVNAITYDHRTANGGSTKTAAGQ